MLAAKLRSSPLLANKASRLSLQRAAPAEKEKVIGGATKFTKKKKTQTTSLAADSKNRQTILKTFETMSKAFRPTIIYPKRTPEELKEAKERTMAWKKERIRADKTMKMAEMLRVKMRRLALEELPEKLRENADKNWTGPVPPEMVWALVEPPLEKKEIFGNYMTGRWNRVKNEWD